MSLFIVMFCFERVLLNQSSIFFAGPLRYLNYIFTGIFIIEAVIRLIAMRLDYFKMGWNVFDFVIVVFSIVGKLLVYDSKLDFFYIRSFNGSFLKCTVCKRSELV